jgi:phosphoserine phosphatase
MESGESGNQPFHGNCGLAGEDQHMLGPLPSNASRQGKEDVVRQLKSKGRKVLAVGDAFNDLEMLRAADFGYLFRPSTATRRAAPNLPVVEDYSQIKEAWACTRSANGP